MLELRVCNHLQEKKGLLVEVHRLDSGNDLNYESEGQAEPRIMVF